MQYAPQKQYFMVEKVIVLFMHFTIRAVCHINRFSNDMCLSRIYNPVQNVPQEQYPMVELVIVLFKDFTIRAV